MILAEMFLLLTAGVIVLVGAHLITGSNQLGSASQLARNIGWAAIVLGILAVAVGAFRWRSKVREQRLAISSPDGLIFGTARPDGLLRILRELAEEDELRAPTDMSVVADGAGLSLWNGPPRSPELIYRLPWHLVQAVEPGTVYMAGVKRHGLLLKVMNGQRWVDFALQPVGAGLLGMYPLSNGEVDQIAQALRTRFVGCTKT